MSHLNIHTKGLATQTLNLINKKRRATDFRNSQMAQTTVFSKKSTLSKNMAKALSTTMPRKMHGGNIAAPSPGRKFSTLEVEDADSVYDDETRSHRSKQS